jgi:hypothetical protein
MLENFFIGLAASLVAAFIVFIAAATLSMTTRRALTAVASAFLGVVVRYVYRNGRAAQTAVQDALGGSRTVRIFAGRGNEFQGSYYLPLFQAEAERAKRVRIMLPNVVENPRGTDWISHREGELAKVDEAFGEGLLRQQIRTTFEFLGRHIKTGRVEVRAYDLPHVGRIILTDEAVFLTPYSDTRHGRDSRVIEFGRGAMYDFFDRMFEMAWLDSRPIEDES